jgi:hypothetical protein
MASMLYLWVRSTASWWDEAAFRRQLDPAFARKVAVWDDTFAVSYREFRHEVHRIAQWNLSNVRDAVLAEWEEIPDEALVAPVDDDDWFSPEVACVLARAWDSEALACVWTSSFLEVPIDLGHQIFLWRRSLFPSTAPRWLCSTNSYAARKRPDTALLLQKHTVASERFGGPDARLVRRIDERLSLMNRTLASQTSLAFLRPTIRRSELLRKWRRYRRLYERPLPPELAWARPYADCMSELMRRLSVK